MGVNEPEFHDLPCFATITGGGGGALSAEALFYIMCPATYTTAAASGSLIGPLYIIRSTCIKIHNTACWTIPVLGFQAGPSRICRVTC